MNIRSQTVSALGQLGNQRAVEALIEALKRRSRRLSNWQIIEQLRDLRQKGILILPPLATFLLHGGVELEELQLVIYLDFLLDLDPTQTDLLPFKPFLLSVILDTVDDKVRERVKELLKIFGEPDSTVN